MAASLDRTALARARRRNRLHSVLILVAIAGLMALAGWLVAGSDGVLWSMLGTALTLVLEPSRSVRLMRALWGAVPLQPHQAPDLLALVAELSRRAALERPPPVWYVPRAEPLALSTGWGRDAAIAVSAGMLRLLPPHELAAVLAHEISHIRAGDLKILRLAEAAGRLTRMLALFGLAVVALLLPEAIEMGAALPLLPCTLLVVTPVASDLMMMKLSRTREFAADAGAADLTGNPRGLMAALARLDGGWERMLRPFPLRWLSWIRTHPTTDERLGRLATFAPAPEPLWLRLPEVLVPMSGRRVMGRWY
jgi:heat shock protein HtpX